MIAVAGATVKIRGREVSAAVADKLVDLVADCELRVPDRLVLRYRDHDLALVDGETFAIGAPITADLGSSEAGSVATVFDGQVTALEPEFTDEGATLVVCALDRGHLLQRTSATSSYQEMSYGQIATAIASSAGLQPGEISDGLSLAFVQRSNETDWDFLWRLALEVDYEVKVEGRQLHFRPAGRPAGTPVALTWGESLLSFRPRVSGVQQVEEVTVRGWDPQMGTAIEGVGTAPTPASRIGLDRSEVVEALGGGSATVVDHPVMGAQHATTLAGSLAAQLASVFVEGEGLADGTPSLDAGGQVRIDGVGQTFAGTYAVTGVVHRYRASSGYRTSFTIAGRAHRTLLGLSRPPATGGWADRIVVGVVASTEDPDNRGRVRVTYPALDETHEGWWARVVAPGSGAGRGFFTLPQVGDEVLICFEHGNDQHPYLLGSVFNGKALPGTVVTKDGTFALDTPKGVTMDAGEKLAFTSKKTLSLTANGATTLTTKPGSDDSEPGTIGITAKGALSLGSDQGVTIDATTTGAYTAKSGLTLSGGTQVTVSADGSITISGASLTLSAKGSVSISAPQISLGA